MVGTAKNLTDLFLLQSARLTLRPLALADAKQLQVITNDYAITSAVHFLRNPFEVSDAQDLIQAHIGTQEVLLGVRIKENDELVGVVGAHWQEDIKIEMGYWIGSAYQRKGYATEAAQAVIAALKTTFPEWKIVAECRPDNSVSWQILERLGFKPMGMAGKRPGRCLLALS
jgi:RimJ/RimL family protein N-acetyltransferase